MGWDGIGRMSSGFILIGVERCCSRVEIGNGL